MPCDFATLDDQSIERKTNRGTVNNSLSKASNTLLTDLSCIPDAKIFVIALTLC